MKDFLMLLSLWLYLIASVLHPQFLLVIPAWFVAGYFYNGMMAEKRARRIDAADQDRRRPGGQQLVRKMRGNCR